MTKSATQVNHTSSDKVGGKNLGQNTTAKTSGLYNSEDNTVNNIDLIKNSTNYKFNQIKEMKKSTEQVSHTSSDKVLGENLGKNTDNVIPENIELLGDSDITNPLKMEFTSEAVDERININDKYRKLLDSLSDGEFSQLQSLIKEQGCKESLIVDENFTLLDGHHRIKICRLFNIPYRVTRMVFQSEEDKMNFILSYHLSRRNLNDLQRSDIRGRIYNAMKKAKTEKGNQYTKSPSATVTRSKTDTAKILEDRFAVSKRTIKRDGKTNESLNKIKEQIATFESENLALEIREKITKQDIPIKKLCLVKICDKPDDFFNSLIKTLIEKYKKDKRSKTDEKKIGKQLNKMIRDFGKKQKETLSKEKPDYDNSMNRLKNAIDTLGINDILSKCILKGNDFFVFENNKVRITLSTK